MSDFETSYIYDHTSKEWLSSKLINIPNRAMNFGDGLFETMKFENGRIRFSDKHLSRLKRGMELLGLDGELINLEQIERFLQENLSKNSYRIRWNVFRSGTGVYTPSSAEISQSLQIKEFSVPPKIKKSAYISEKSTVYPTPWCNAKTLNALTYVLANQERVTLGKDEVILLDHQGFLSEAGSSNIFWRKGDEIFTPSLDCSCIAGVGREVILESLKDQGRKINEGKYLPGDLENADVVWVSNAMGISYLENISGVNYDIEPISFLEKLFE